MQIFYLDHDPVLAAKYHCDQHVCSQIQDVSAVLASIWKDPSLPTIKCPRKLLLSKLALEVRCGGSIFQWLLRHICALFDEFEVRFGHKHAYEVYLISFCVSLHSHKIRFPRRKYYLSRLSQKKYLHDFRYYYRHQKGIFAKFTNGFPPWWNDENILREKRME